MGGRQLQHAGHVLDVLQYCMRHGESRHLGRRALVQWVIHSHGTGRDQQRHGRPLGSRRRAHEPAVLLKRKGSGTKDQHQSKDSAQSDEVQRPPDQPPHELLRPVHLWQVWQPELRGHATHGDGVFSVATSVCVLGDASERFTTCMQGSVAEPQ